jgi:hypothetical protein
MSDVMTSRPKPWPHRIASMQCLALPIIVWATGEATRSSVRMLTRRTTGIISFATSATMAQTTQSLHLLLL